MLLRRVMSGDAKRLTNVLLEQPNAVFFISAKKAWCVHEEWFHSGFSLGQALQPCTERCGEAAWRIRVRGHFAGAMEASLQCDEGVRQLEKWQWETGVRYLVGRSLYPFPFTRSIVSASSSTRTPWSVLRNRAEYGNISQDIYNIILNCIRCSTVVKNAKFCADYFTSSFSVSLQSNIELSCARKIACTWVSEHES